MMEENVKERLENKQAAEEGKGELWNIALGCLDN
jgi:hypothetical protein